MEKSKSEGTQCLERDLNGRLGKLGADAALPQARALTPSTHLTRWASVSPSEE